MDPKTGFVIMRDDELSDTRRRSLDLLYQPLLHPVAYALVNLLWQLSEISSNPLFQRPLHDLLSYLSIDMKAFKVALHRVEGAGLLKTFYKHDSYQTFYIFHLIQPLSAREFFHEDLLSIGLLEIVGNHRFANLSRALIPRPHAFKNTHDLTRNFLEVYNVGPGHITNLPEQIRRTRAEISAKTSSSLKSDRQFIDQAPDFDFGLLIQILKGTYSDVRPVKQHRHLIMTEHTLYGIDELAMANYIEQATSVSSNRINFNRFKWLIAKAFQGNSRIPAKTRFTSKSKPDNVKSSSKLSYEKRGLIKAADYYSPVQFLHHLKKKLNPNGFVTRQEEAVLGQMVSYGGFRDNRGVINILVYYCLAEKRMPTLKSAFMQYMITAWNQAKVNTPADALAEIEAHQQKRIQKWQHRQARRKGHSGYYKPKPRIKQKLPKWARSGYHVKLHPTSPKLQQKIKQQLKNLNHRSKK